jgi:hypothetical protein
MPSSQNGLDIRKGRIGSLGQQGQIGVRAMLDYGDKEPIWANEIGRVANANV